MNFRLFPSEEFKEIEIKDKLRLKYAVSNYGRVISFSESMEAGRLIKIFPSNGYNLFRYVLYVNGKRVFKSIFMKKLVAEYFIPKPSEEHKHVIHLDYNRLNDFVKNLKWVTTAEQRAHNRKSPLVIEMLKKLHEHRRNSKGNKLTEAQVIILKKKLLDPNRKTRLKILARQFGVSEMTLHRIRTGENWGHIKV
ncbi:MAG TPA: NUMOD4 domain-containing protein [Bacteroidia bacterium]|nr:NUMOD4 domain-containing protein [Bacteroidia bacterium]